MDGSLSGGFADPARDGARAFRAALDAMARPGRIHVLEGAVPPGDLAPAAGVLLLTLTDRTTPLWIAPLTATPALARWIAFHTGAPDAEGRSSAAFGLGTLPALLPLGVWPQGSADYPDRSATLIAEVPSLRGGTPLTLRGPGIETHLTVAPETPDGFARELRRNRAAYPLGVDLFLVCGAEVMALPRTVRLEG